MRSLIMSEVDVSQAAAKFVEISISTTAGFFPEQGFDRLPENQKIDVQLEKAKRKLGITDTAGWIATVNAPGGKHTLIVDRSYSENQLSGEVEIDWGPSEGG